jgi:hypothetical protein
MLWRRSDKGEPPNPIPSPDQPGTDAELSPILEGLDTAREQAVALVSALVEAGLSGKAMPIDRLATAHTTLCRERGCAARGWFAVARELKRMGLRKAKVWVKGNLVTYYELPASAGPVVDLAAVQRQRA